MLRVHFMLLRLGKKQSLSGVIPNCGWVRSSRNFIISGNLIFIYHKNCADLYISAWYRIVLQDDKCV